MRAMRQPISRLLAFGSLRKPGFTRRDSFRFVTRPKESPNTSVVPLSELSTRSTLRAAAAKLRVTPFSEWIGNLFPDATNNH